MAQAAMLQPEQVPFPPDLPNWALVCGMLTELQERLLNEMINEQDAALHIQVIYEASQSPQPLDENWLHSQQGAGGQRRSGQRKKLDQSYLWFGMLKFLKKAEKEERERFLFTTLPNIIELALRVEDHLFEGRLCYSQRQRGGTTVLSRQFIASILACSFLCLFPERVRDRTSKLNVVNFTNFFKHLPQSSQVAKLRCILHYFERVVDSGLDMAGSIKFHRQVADKNALPTMEDLVKSDVCLCPLVVHTEGVIEDTGSSAVQVDFANRSIGGGVLGRGRVQEEIRFSVCPELIAAMVFMENMEANEAIIITGFEQFAQTTGYAASLQFAGPFHDSAQRDAAGNLLNTLCAIDATSFRWGSQNRQYSEGSVMRELCKAYVGFCQAEPEHMWRSVSSTQQTPSDEDFLTAQESVEEEVVTVVSPKILEMADAVSRTTLSQGIVEAARIVTAFHASLLASEDDLHLAEVSLGSNLSDGVPPCGQSASTPRDDAGPASQSLRDEVNAHALGGNGERMSLPMIVPRPQNGSCDLLEVDYTEWLANFRRRSSQLSDLTSRRSSSSTKHSSEFSSDLEEIYETLVQAEKAQHGIIEEETYGAALSEFAASFVSGLMREGTSVAAQMLPDMKDFREGQAPVGVHRPQVIRPAGVHFEGDNGSSDMVSHADDMYDSDDGHTGAAANFKGGRSISVEELVSIQSYVSTLVDDQINSGVREAAEAVASGCLEPAQEDVIPDDVYVWFADKIVQEVFCQAVDELYFQRFTSDSRWRAELSVNREGVQRRLSYEERKDSLSSSSSCSSLLHDRLDTTKSSSSPSGQSLESDTPGLQTKKGKSISWSNIPPATSGPSDLDSSRESRSSCSSKDDRNTVASAESTDRGVKGEGKSVSFTLGAVESSFLPSPQLSVLCKRTDSSGLGGKGEDVSVLSERTDSKLGKKPDESAFSKSGRKRDKSFSKKTDDSAPSRTPDGSVLSKSGLCGKGDVSSTLSKRTDVRSLDQKPADLSVLSQRTDVSTVGSKADESSVHSKKTDDSGLDRTSSSAVDRMGILSEKWDDSGLERTARDDSSLEKTAALGSTGDSRTAPLGTAPLYRTAPCDRTAPLDRAGDSRMLVLEERVACTVSRSTGESSDDHEVERTKMLSPSPIITLKTIPPTPSPSTDIPPPLVPTEPSGTAQIGVNKPAFSVGQLTDASTDSVRDGKSVAEPSGATQRIALTGVNEPPVSIGQLKAVSTGCIAVNEPPLSVGQLTDMSTDHISDARSMVSTCATSGTSAYHESSVTKSTVQETRLPSGDVSQSKSVPSSPAVSATPHATAHPSDASLSGSEPTVASDQPGASTDLNLDCYRAAAEIVNQVFQSLPEHLAKLSESGKGYRGSHFYGRKYDSFLPRSSKEVAAAVIGASEKGNVVTESCMQTKTSPGVYAAGRASPRRTRSQSPCFSWLTNRLSRETLTNAFVKVESKPVVKSYERRSSEPCQRSVNLSLQAFSSSHFSSNRSEEGVHKKVHEDDDFDGMHTGSWRRGSFDSISLDRRRSSGGFKDPTLSRFAQELMNADTSVPPLLLMSSGPTSSTTESRRSSLSGFRDTTLATFESELLNLSFGQTPSSPPRPKPKRSQSRESHLWKSDSSEAEYWFPIPRRVGSEFQEEMQRLSRHYSVEEVEDYAEFIATSILQQAVAVLHHDLREITQEDADINIFSENLADQILREAMVTSAQLPRRSTSRPQLIRSVSGSELDLSMSSNDPTGRSLDDRLTDFQDALDVPYNRVEAFAAKLARDVLSRAMDEFGVPVPRVFAAHRPIATGNWGCGAFHGDPCLKVTIQWMAASLAHAPQLLYFTFGDGRLQQLPAVIQMIIDRGWTVGQLMTAVQAYCLTVLSDESWQQEAASTSAAAASDPDIPLQTLFDFLLTQP